MKKAIVLASALAAGLPAMAFTPAMESPDVKVEVTTRYGKGESLEVIASAAKAVNIPAAVLAPGMLSTGNSTETVMAAMIKAGYFPTELVDALEATGAGANSGGAAFSSSRAATIGGGGSRAVSRS